MRLTSGFFFVVSLAFAGCSSAESVTPVPQPGTPTSSIFATPASLSELDGKTFFDHPWPSDLRLENGSPRFTGYYNPKGLAIIDEYVGAMKDVLDGFSPVAAGFLRFTGSIDPASLPADPTAATKPTASAQLIDVDPKSPEHGQRKLVSFRYRDAEGVYWREHTLAFMPTLGYPLRPHTRYALVVTDGLKTPLGAAVVPAAELAESLGVRPPTSAQTTAAAAALAPAVAELGAAGIAKEHVVHLSVFTTTDPAIELFAARDDLRKSVPAPSFYPTKWDAQPDVTADHDEYIGVYGPSPNYQDGQIPYATYGTGGAFKIQDGHPVAVNLFDLRFSLTVPNAAKCPMPAAGYPIVLYAHGTGGNYRTYLDDGTGQSLAQHCLATMGVDQIFHGTRPGAPVCDPQNPAACESTIEILYFNFENITAARHNARQSALDEVQRARLFTETHVTVPASLATTKADILFDPTKVLFFGHSQGGHNGPLYLAADDSSRGGVLSGSGALLSITLLEKTLPTPSVAQLVKTVFLGLITPEQASEISEFHPAISLAQTIVDVVDPLNYARYTIGAPRKGFAPKSVYMTEGVNPDGTGDSYAPPHGIEMHGLSMGLPLQLPSQRAIAEEAWGGPAPIMVPAAGLAGNLGAGAASGIFAQWAVPKGHDGHFVVFDVPAARAQAAQFCRNLADDPKGKIPAP